MPFSRGEFHQDWVRVDGWGRAVVVESLADLELVRRFIADAGDFRRAVFLQNVTTAERRTLESAIEELGVGLSEFTKSEQERLRIPMSTIQQAVVMWGVLVLSLPYRIVLRVQGRRSVMLVMTPRFESDAQVAGRAGG